MGATISYYWYGSPTPIANDEHVEINYIENNQHIDRHYTDMLKTRPMKKKLR